MNVFKENRLDKNYNMETNGSKHILKSNTTDIDEYPNGMWTYDGTSIAILEQNSSTGYFESTETENQTHRFNGLPSFKHVQRDMDAQYFNKTNSFWLQFEPPDPQTYYVMAIIYMIIMAVGCFGNALVIYMFIRCKSLRTPANVLVINLAVSDFFMVAKSPIAIYNSLKHGPALGDIGCRLYGFMGGLTGTASIMTLTAIAIDRYHVVVYPLNPLRFTTKLRSRFFMCFIWTYSFGFSIIPAMEIGFSEYVPEGYLTTCSFDYLSKSPRSRIFMFTFFVGAWCIPFMTISYCYFYILKVVSMANGIQSSRDKNKTEIKLAVIVIIVILLWFLAWTPYSIVALLGITGNENHLTPLASMIPAIFCKVSACIDPYIYAVTHPRFRMEFSRMVFGPNYMRRTSTYRSSVTITARRQNRIIHDGDDVNEEINFKNNNLTELKLAKTVPDFHPLEFQSESISYIDQSSRF